MIWLTRDYMSICLWLQDKPPKFDIVGEIYLMGNSRPTKQFNEKEWLALGLKLPELNSCQQIHGLAIKKGRLIKAEARVKELEFKFSKIREAWQVIKEQARNQLHNVGITYCSRDVKWDAAVKTMEEALK